MITNTHSVGVVRDGRHSMARRTRPARSHRLLVVAARRRGNLGRLAQRHQRIPRQNLNTRFRAIDSAHSGAVEEGNIGGGTGMVCNEFKGGIGTSSRKIESKIGAYMVGVLVQCNYGSRQKSPHRGVPVGREIPEDPAYASTSFNELDRGSIIVVVATDAPLVSHQLKRLARRVSLGLGRNGSISGNGSGDIFIAFSTTNTGAAAADHVVDLKNASQ